jgi:multiple sugar transport system substrate-binding protein
MTLTGITWDHARGYNPLVACADRYRQLHGIRVEWQKRSLADFGDQSLEELAGQFDLLVIDHPHVGVALESKSLYPLDELLPEAVLKELEEASAGPSFSSYRYQGKTWAVPVDAAVQCAAWRPDLMGETALPTSWEDVFALQQTLQKKGLQIGMALCPTDCACSFLTLTAQLGSPLEEGNGCLIHQAKGLQTLELLRKMRDHFHADSLEWNPIRLYDHMSTHDEVAYAPLAFGYTNYARTGFRKKILAFGDAPGLSCALLGGAGMGVSARRPFAEEAARFAAWMGSAAVQSSLYVTAQGQPANRVAWESEEANNLTRQFFRSTVHTLERAYTRPRYFGWLDFQISLGSILHGFLREDSDPLKTFTRLQDAYRASCKIHKQS